MADLLKNNVTGQNSGFKFPVNRMYDKYKETWQNIRDAIEGQKTVKDAGERYLPKLSDQDATEYRAYKYRAVFFGISARLLSTNVGVIVRRTPTTEYSKDMEKYFILDDMSFSSFDEVRRELTRELSAMGRVAVLVDVVKDIPIPKIIPTESIINWTKDDDGIVSSVLLGSTVYDVDPVTFEETSQIIYFRLFLNTDGFYSITTYLGNGSEETDVISVRGAKLKYIPFYPINPYGVDIEPAKAPMSDIVDINYSHYMTSADLENGRHFVGLPTPYVTGTTTEKRLKVGSETAWIIPSKDATVGFLEFLGQGLGSLERALQEKQSQMSQFSAQLMDTSSRGSEAEGTVRLRYSSDAANLTDIAHSTEACLNLSYGAIADWQGFEKPKIELNKDFLSTKMSHNELTALTKSLVDGAITEEVFMYNLERGEMTPNKQTL